MSEVDFRNIEPPDWTGHMDSEANRLAGRPNDQEGERKYFRRKSLVTH